MTEYTRVNCIAYCPKCKHLRQIIKLKEDLSPIFWLDCRYMSDVVIDELSKCNGMFEPKEASDA